MVSVCRIICFVQDGLAADVQQTKDDMRYTQLTSWNEVQKLLLWLKQQKSCTKSTLLYFADETQSVVMIRAMTSSNAT